MMLVYMDIVEESFKFKQEQKQTCRLRLRASDLAQVQGKKRNFDY